jgi:pimeloyl-ACP methyl ester carboxylesterase
MLAAALARLPTPPAPDRLSAAEVAVDGGRGWLAVTTLAAPSLTAADGQLRPLVLLLHGLGDTSATFRLLAPRIADGGYTVVAPDLRGCGRSSTRFSSWAPEAAAQDALAVAEQAAGGDRAALEARGAILVAHSYSAASAVWLAAEAPRTVRGLVLLGPFVRDPNEGRGLSFGMRLMLGTLFARPWGPGMWASYYANTLHKHPQLDRPDLQRHAAEIRGTLDGGHLAALRGMIFATKRACTDRLPEVRAPSLTIVGRADPDYPDPAAEATYITTALAAAGRAEQLLLDGCGHYPHFEQVAETAFAILEYAKTLSPAA